MAEQIDYQNAERPSERRPLGIGKRLLLWPILTLGIALLIASIADRISSDRAELMLYPMLWVSKLISPRDITSTSLILANAMFWALLIAFGIRRRS